MNSKFKLFSQAITRFLAGLVLVGAIIFLSAGTLSYTAGWLFMAVLFVPMFIARVVMQFCNPELLKKRLNAKEKEAEQKGVVALSGLMFITAFVIAGLDYRYSWTVMPSWVVWSAVVIFLLAYIMYAEVLRENVYLSRTIEVQNGQKVIDTGLYAVVRHPMYSATILLFLSMPIILGSLPSFFIMLVYIPIIVKRINNEEKVLKEGLCGYDAYCKRVRYKLLPLVY